MEKIKIAALNLQAGVGTTKGYLQYLTTFWKYAVPHSHKQIMNVINFICSEGIDIAVFAEVNTSKKAESRSNQAGFISKQLHLKKIDSSEPMVIRGLLSAQNIRFCQV